MKLLRKAAIFLSYVSKEKCITDVCKEAGIPAQNIYKSVIPNLLNTALIEIRDSGREKLVLLTEKGKLLQTELIKLRELDIR